MFILAVVVTTASAVEVASAAGLSWRPEQTVELVRGVPEPDVAVADDGRAALVYSSMDYFGRPRLNLRVRRANTPEPFIGGAATSPGGTSDASVAMSPSGVTAVAAIEAGRLFVTMYPAGAQDRYRGKIVEIEAPGVADEPLLGIDAAGRATVVWASPPRLTAYGQSRPRQVYAVTVGPDAAAGPVQALGEPGNCDPALDVNLRGDAVVAVSCPGSDATVFQRPADGSFDVGVRPFAGTPGTVQVGIDGQGVVHAIQGHHTTIYRGRFPDAEYHLSYAVRPAGGAFSPPEVVRRPGGRVGPLDLEVQESGRAIAGWVEGGRLLYAVRTASGSFAPATTAGNAARAATRDRDAAFAVDVVASPNGAVLLVWREGAGHSRTRVTTAMLGVGGTLVEVFKAIPGLFPSASTIDWSPAFAINDAGQVAGAWEQLCAGPHSGLAVMAVQRDVGGRPKAPPCQDAGPPWVTTQRATLVGRKLRVRIGCNEECRIVVRARVVRGGKGRLLATARTRRAQTVDHGGRRTFVLRLTARQAAEVRAARAARRRISVRLALSLRDRYGNAVVRRGAVPLRR
jgi:hypothetical protein